MHLYNVYYFHTWHLMFMCDKRLTYVHTCIHSTIDIHSHANVYVSTCMLIHMRMDICTWMYVYAHMPMYACIGAYVDFYNHWLECVFLFSVIGLLRTLNPPKGEYILQTAAASILGRMFIQYAHHQGYKVRVSALSPLWAYNLFGGATSCRTVNKFA